jgi:hypothetical protein
MSRECSANGGEEERIEVIGGKPRRKENTRKTKMYVVYNIKVFWIGLAQDRDKWSNFVNVVMNLSGVIKCC